MEFESVSAAAERLGVTSRAVQKWAAAGKLPGAKRVGRAWLIPAGAKKIVSHEQKPEKTQPYFQIYMPLMSSSFKSGHCREFIEKIEDPTEKAIAKAEYYYYTARPEKAIHIAEKYLDHSDMGVALSSNFIYAFSSLAISNADQADSAFKNIVKYATAIFELSERPELKAIAVLAVTTIYVIMHIKLPDSLPHLREYLCFLPEGLRLFASYVLAYRRYNEKRFDRSLGIADTAIFMCLKDYPVASIYANIVAAMNLISMKQNDEARERFLTAFEIARKDGFTEVIGEHYGVLLGIIEFSLKRKYPEEYKKIISVAKPFCSSWRKVHNHTAKNGITDALTINEFTVAMLYSRGWMVKEIAAHIDVSERMVKHHISVIYEKLGVSNRIELSRFILI